MCFGLLYACLFCACIVLISENQAFFLYCPGHMYRQLSDSWFKSCIVKCPLFGSNLMVTKTVFSCDKVRPQVMSTFWFRCIGGHYNSTTVLSFDKIKPQVTAMFDHLTSILVISHPVKVNDPYFK